MTPVSLRDNRGFTLTEVLIALVIMVVGMIGLLQALGVAYEHNLRNQSREEAVRIGEKYMSELRGKLFTKISTAGYSPRYEQSRRGGGRTTYTVLQSANTLDTDSSGPTVLQLEVNVQWTYKGVQYSNRVLSPLSRPPQ